MMVYNRRLSVFRLNVSVVKMKQKDLKDQSIAMSRSSDQLTELPYYPYSQWLKAHYGEKVYKIPINAAGTCPNRDGKIGYGGCIFCGAFGGGNETLRGSINISEQLEINKAYIGKRYHARKFIPFLQDFSNTYLPFDQFKKNIAACLGNDVVGIAISTRPDCVTNQQIDWLKDFKQQHHIDIVIELGLQSANAHSLQKLNRGHGLADYIDVALRIKSAGLQLCTHMILDLPWDDDLDIIEGAKLLSVVKNDFVKCHSLYIEKGTELAKMIASKEVHLLSLETYLHRAKLFLGYLDPKIALQRIIGRAPKRDSILTNWNTSWWKIRDRLVDEMTEVGLKQGDLLKADREKLSDCMK